MNKWQKPKAPGLPGGISFCLPLIAGLVLFYLVPFGITLYKSLQAPAGQSFCGLQNYRELFSNAAFRLAVQNTLRFWCMALPLNLLLGFALAQLCAACKAKRALPWLLFPALIPAGCSVAFFKAGAELLTGQKEIAPQRLFWLLLLVYLWKSGGLTAAIFYAGLKKIPREILETGMDLGAGRWELVRKIEIPLLLPAAGVSLLTALMAVFRIFREAYLLGGAHPDKSIYSLQHFYYNNFANLNIPRLAAASIWQIALIAAAAALCKRLLQKSDHRK